MEKQSKNKSTQYCQKGSIRSFYSYNLPLLEVYWCTVSWIRFVLGNTRIGWRWNIRLINFLLCIIRLIWIGYGRRCINLFFIHPWSCDLKTQEIKSFDGFLINTILSTYIIQLYLRYLYSSLSLKKIQKCWGLFYNFSAKHKLWVILTRLIAANYLHCISRQNSEHKIVKQMYLGLHC